MFKNENAKQALVFFAGRQFDKAISSFNSAIADIGETDTAQLAKIYKTMGSVYIANKQNTDALAAYNKALEIYQQHLPAERTEMELISSKIEVLEHECEDQKHIKQSSSAADSILTDEQAVEKIAIARSCRESGQFQEAERLYKEIYSSLQQQDQGHPLLVSIDRGFGKIYLQQKKFVEAST